MHLSLPLILYDCIINLYICLRGLPKSSNVLRLGDIASASGKESSICVEVGLKNAKSMCREHSQFNRILRRGCCIESSCLIQLRLVHSLIRVWVH